MHGVNYAAKSKRTNRLVSAAMPARPGGEAFMQDAKQSLMDLKAAFRAKIPKKGNHERA